jgi:hypothetical protein
LPIGCSRSSDCWELTRPSFGARCPHTAASWFWATRDFNNDQIEVNAAEWIVYDALYAYAKEMVKRGKPAGQFAH